MYGATIPEDAEAILPEVKNQAPGALDEESGGDSQPASKSYSRIIAAALLLLSFVLVAGAAAGNASGSSSTECPPGTPPGAICPYGGHAPEWPLYHDQSGKSVTSSLSSTECPPGTDPQFQCETAYGYCRAHCSSGIAVPELQERCRNTCSIALGRCCDN